jgi:endoglucanase
MLGINDPVNNYAFEVHQYLDSNSSGTSSQCVEGAGSSRLAAFSNWARANNRKGFLGEFGVANNETCLAELNGLLQHMQANGDVWIGWTYWAGGPWWGAYPFSVEPESLQDPVDRPQMQILIEYL